jgi:hypothetical protein
MNEPHTKALEQEARKLRDAIYGPCKEETWEQVKDKWMNDIAWLRQYGGPLLTKTI